MTTWSFLSLPSQYSFSEGRVSFETKPETDYWHTPTAIRTNGHFYQTAAPLPLEYGIHVQCTLHGDWRAQFDQGGIMMRASETHWIKAGVEYVDGQPFLRYFPHPVFLMS
jgi:regulation of enolase protein 1 (concanavalin A-like superfamily)